MSEERPRNRRKAVIYKKLYLTGIAKLLRPGTVAYCSRGRTLIWSEFTAYNGLRLVTHYEKTGVGELETYSYTKRIKSETTSHTCPICDVPKPAPEQEPSAPMNFRTAQVEVIITKE